MKIRTLAGSAMTGAAILGMQVPATFASSHMDAPLITFDDAANTTDVYAFLTEKEGEKYLTTSLAVYPFETPGIGPNKHTFDDDVLYEIHVATGDDVAAGTATYSFQFLFETTYKSEATILQSYLGIIDDVDGEFQNLTQAYTVTMVDRSDSSTTELGEGLVPPNNQGIATPFYNQDSDGNMPALNGVATEDALDAYTEATIYELDDGFRVFAGQREDGFYGDIQSIFDLLQLRTAKSFDSQSGFNVHTIVLDIPVDMLGGDMQQVGVYATTSRRAVRTLMDGAASSDPTNVGDWIQVGRQGNPLFAEALVAIEDKNLYNRTSPEQDAALFTKYAEKPELAALINALIFDGETTAIEDDRADLVGIFIPDLIKVDLSTGPARLAGGSAGNPDDEGFSRLGIFGMDTLTSQISDGFGDGAMPGGWPNGRRYGDDVVDIAISAILSDLRDPENLVIMAADGIDNVNSNDRAYNKVFPYASTPLNGRNYQVNPQFFTGQNSLVNLAARGWVSGGENDIIGGFIIRGTMPKTVMVTAKGPSLAEFGVENPLANPRLTVYNADMTPIEGGENDDYVAEDGEDPLPFAPTDENEAAVILTLDPGLYTTILSGEPDTEGVALIEVYDMDAF